MASRQPELPPFLAALSRGLTAARFPFMLIGGQAVLVHGRPRLTDDIDVTLGAGPQRLPDLLAVCAALDLRPLPDDVEPFVRDTFVLPARHEASGLRVDFIFSTTAYEAAAIARAVRVTVGGEAVPFATAEDLVLHKLFAARPRDLEDARSVVSLHGTALDWEYLRRWAAAFAEVPGREGMPALLESLRDEGPA